MSTRNYEYIISEGSCNGEENEFASWIEENIPNITVTIENVLLSSSLFDADTGEALEEGSEFGFVLWEKYGKMC